MRNACQHQDSVLVCLGGKNKYYYGAEEHSVIRLQINGRMSWRLDVTNLPALSTIDGPESSLKCSDVVGHAGVLKLHNIFGGPIYCQV